MFEHGNPRTSNPENRKADHTGDLAPASDSPHAFLGHFAIKVAATTSDALSERELTDRLQICEEAKIRIAALQARDTAALRERIAERKADPTRAKEHGASGTGTELALARRETPAEGCKHLAGSQILCADMPLTMSLFTFGVITEAKAMRIALEVVSLTPEHRRWVDGEINKTPEDHTGEPLNALGERVRKLVQEINPATTLDNIDTARAKRYVRFIPTENLMMRIIADVPAEQGLLMQEVLGDLADSATAAGKADGRTREQLRADLFCSLVTGDTNVTPAVEINLVMTDRTLFQGGPEAAHLQGYGAIPASMARQLVRGRDTDLKLKRWIRRLYTEPDTSKLLAMDSRRRIFPAGLVHWVQIRDQHCATPGCPNRVRHTDHIAQWFRGGATSADNASARCVWCNNTKEYPGWEERSTSGWRHGLEVITPTGKVYTSMAPPLPGARTTHPPDPH